MEALLHLAENPKHWIALAFVLFLALFIRKAVPGISGLLDKRSERIQSELDEALRLREEAQAVLAEYQRRQREVEAEAKAILASAEDEAAALKLQAENELKSALERRLGMAKDKIAQAEKDAIRNVQDNIVDIAVHAARTLITEQMDGATDDELIEIAIDDIPRIVH